MKIFVSSTYKDLKEYRTVIKDAILKAGHHPIMMEDFTSSNDPAETDSLKKVEEANVFIGIYARRYGHVADTDNISITEKEYWHAKKNRKQIYLFQLDRNVRWPSEHKDKDSRRLAKFAVFLKEINDQYVVKEFSSKEELVLQLSPILGRLSDKESELRFWKGRLENIDYEKKMKLIDQLAFYNDKGELNDEAFNKITKLVASDFSTDSPVATTEMIQTTGGHLDGNLTIKEFVDKVNDLTQLKWHQKVFRNMKSLSFSIILFIAIGLFLGFLSYRFNWFNARVVYLAGKKANRMDVIKWMVNTQAFDNLDIEDVSNSKTQIGLAALYLAYQIDSESPIITNFIDNYIKNIRKTTRLKSASEALLIHNKKILETMCSIVSHPLACEEARSMDIRIAKYADSTRALKISRQILKDYQNPDAPDSLLIFNYSTLLDSFPQYIDTTKVKNECAKLEKSFDLYKLVYSKLNNPSLTINQKKVAFSAFLSIRKRQSPEVERVRNDFQKLLDMEKKSAWLESEDRFVTTTFVNKETLDHAGLVERFSPGTIWIWAKICTPGPEKVKIVWLKNNEVFYAKTVSIPVKSSGYRIYYSKNYPSGKYPNEVRLYNSKNILIGSRVFTVIEYPTTQK